LVTAFGGAARWAMVCSFITTAELNDIEPFAYLKDVLKRMPSGHPMSRLDDQLPWNWRPSNVTAYLCVSGMDAYLISENRSAEH
jgi:hypothetical protein